MSNFPIGRRLTADLLAEIADLRAHGHSWEAAAREVGWDAPALRRAVRSYPEYARLYQEAEAEVLRESVAEMLHTYRGQLRHPDEDTARKAADAIAKHAAGERRDRTRVAVEQMRTDATRAKAEAKKLKAEPPATEPRAAELAPEDVHRPEREAAHARRAANDRAVVWLWGGTHKIGGVAPDANTDTPLVLFSDDTVPGRKLFWAARFPLPGDPFDGPFPVPPQEPAPMLTAEQAQHLNPGRTEENSV